MVRQNIMMAGACGGEAVHLMQIGSRKGRRDEI
jgi:hypothetical protein